MSRFSHPKAWLPLVLTLVVLGIARIQIGDTPTGAPEASEQHLAEVAEAIDAIPFKLGRWLGRDEEVNPAAFELLNPNRIFQRRYTHLDRPELSFSLLVTHCPDEDDMLGHYPPVCYPAHGWLSGPREPKTYEWNGSEIPALRYEFTRQQGLARLDMVVVNFFVLPSTRLPFADSMNSLRRPDVLITRREGGIAQVQVLMTKGLSSEDEALILLQAIGAVEAMLEAIHSPSLLGDGGEA